MPKILVTGANGFLGRRLVPLLRGKYGEACVLALTRADYDLTDMSQVTRMFEERQPEAVIHLAAYVGGIGANRDYPATFYYRNTLLTAFMFQAASDYRLPKLIYPMGGCSYPARAASPIGEAQMLNGYPQAESAGYSMAKKMALVASESYRKQCGLESVVVIPGNMYGEYDNFREGESHVTPALIRRVWEAKQAGTDLVPCWGSGRPVRDFVYAGDVAATFPFFLERYRSSEPVNISSGTAISIRELAETIKELVGYEGEFIWDASMPDGQMEKIFDVARMESLGLECRTSLRDGLRKTIAWFTRHYADRSDGIRL
jgi:GDP-L-fucose synthase